MFLFGHKLCPKSESAKKNDNNCYRTLISAYLPNSENFPPIEQKGAGFKRVHLINIAWILVCDLMLKLFLNLKRLYQCGFWHSSSFWR